MVYILKSHQVPRRKTGILNRKIKRLEANTEYLDSFPSKDTTEGDNEAHGSSFAYNSSHVCSFETASDTESIPDAVVNGILLLTFSPFSVISFTAHSIL